MWERIFETHKLGRNVTVWHRMLRGESYLGLNGRLRAEFESIANETRLSLVARRCNSQLEHFMRGKVILVTGAFGALGVVVVDMAIAQGAQVGAVDFAPKS